MQEVETLAQRSYTPLTINRTEVERMSSFNYVCVHISEDLTWTQNIYAQQSLYHLRQLKKFRVSARIQKTFSSCAVEGIPTQKITSWFGNSCVQDHKVLQTDPGSIMLH